MTIVVSTNLPTHPKATRQLRTECTQPLRVGGSAPHINMITYSAFVCRFLLTKLCGSLALFRATERRRNPRKRKPNRALAPRVHRSSLLQNPGSRILDPGSWIQDPGSRILDPETRILGPGSWFQDPGSRMDPASRILDPGSWIQDGSCIQDPRSWIHDPGS